MSEELSTVEARLLERLAELAKQYDRLGEQMSDPAVAADPVRMSRLLKEHGRLKRIVEPYRQYEQVCDQIAEARSILEDDSADPELKDLAKQELTELTQRRDELMETIKEALVTDEDASVDSILLEIRAGTGGEEAALFARDLFEMYQRYAQKKGFTFEVMDASPTDLGGFREVIVNIKGPGVYRYFGYEAGGHRVQRVPKTEAQGRIHTSAATVAVLPEPEEIDIQIDWDKDVIEHVSRAGGPGGQNVNKVSSAIKLEHVPTGITVSIRDERSQHKNRAKARRILASKVYDFYRRQQESQIDQARRSMIGSGDRSQRIRTYNFPQNRVTDHRINLDLYKLQAIMQGELDELIEALQLHDKQQRLKNLSLEQFMPLQQIDN